MRFVVSRTTLHDDDTPPIAGAVKGTIAVWDRRGFATPEEHDAKIADLPGMGGRWADTGVEHGYWEAHGNRGIQRRMPDQAAWFIEVETLDDLLALHREHGDLVLTTSFEDGQSLEIEIYDGYRE